MNYQTCDPQALSDYIAGRLSTAEELELTAHLDQCPECGLALEREVASPCEWQEMHVLLADDVPAEPSYPTRDAEINSSLVEHIVSQLAPTDDPNSLGRIGNYEVTGVIGIGGMGIVFKAHDRSLDRIVAIKVLAPQLAASGAARQRFAREAKAAAAVLHPNVIAIHTVANDLKLPYLVMPYIRGNSLQCRIDNEGPLTTLEVLRIAAQVASGLAAAHEQGLVHRDIKPANILLEQGVERVTITDFGLARASDDASMTRSGAIAGTPQYMSPEQARGEPIDARSDLFSLGAMLYAMCTGHSPFRAETSYGVLHRITHEHPRPISEINSDIPPWLEKLIFKLLAKSPENRFQSANELAGILEGCLAHIQHPTAHPLPETLTAARKRPFQWRVLVGFAVLFCSLLAAFVIYLETQKGTLRIETNSDAPVTVVIRRSELAHPESSRNEIIERITVSSDGASTRLKAGEYTIEVEGVDDRVVIENGTISLHRGQTWLASIKEINTNDNIIPSDSVSTSGKPTAEQLGQENPLVGRWRVTKLLYEDDEEVPTDNFVITIDDWNLIWWEERTEPDQYIYRLQPDDQIQMVEIGSKSPKDMQFTMKYTVIDPHTLLLKRLDNDSQTEDYSLELERIHDHESSSAFVSYSFDVDTSESDDLLNDKGIEAEINRIRSEAFLSQVPISPEYQSLLSEDDSINLQWFKQNLFVKHLAGNQVELGLYGHNSTKRLRYQLLESIAESFHSYQPHAGKTVVSTNDFSEFDIASDILNEVKAIAADIEKVVPAEPARKE